jgi:hypothetical protein
MRSIDIEKRNETDGLGGNCHTVRSLADVRAIVPPRGSWVSFRTDSRKLSAQRVFSLLLSRCPCDRCLVSTFNISARVGAYLDQAVATDHVRVLDALVSFVPTKLNREGGLPLLLDTELRFPGRVRVRTADVHAKVYCLAMESGDNFVVECSANLAANSRIELYTIWNSESRLLWHASWLGEFFA